MLADKVKRIIYEAVVSCGFENTGIDRWQDVPLEIPRSKDHGDFATNLSLTLAKPLKRTPGEIAGKIVGGLAESAIIGKAEIAGPGFINLTVAPDTLRGIIEEVRDAGADYGKSDIGKGKKVQVEFVSANPTGPLSVGHGRIAAIGDTIARLLEACGYETVREYYVNDIGNQIKNLAISVDLRYKEALGQDVQLDQAGYQGEYIKTYALELKKEYGDSLLKKDDDERRKLMADYTIKRVLDEQDESLKKFGVAFDRWFGEHELYDADLVEDVLKTLKEKGALYEDEGALWFATSKYRYTQDRVLKKSGGASTYFLSDIAYHKNKFDRGFDIVIDIWGADHHGYIARMKSAMEALGIDPDKLEIAVVQLVRFKKSGDFVRMSKRAGNLVTLSDLVDEVGCDAARFFFLMRTKESHLDFDIELAKERSEKNPMFYLQYAHARICSLLQKAGEEGVEVATGADLALLETPRELALMSKLANFPWEVQTCCLAREPHRIITFLTELAGDFHAFYHGHRVVSDKDKALSSARLALCAAVQTVFANGLSLLGITAPESM